MEVARRFWRTIAAAVAAFVGEACFRAELAFDVLRGGVPMVRPRRWWNRNAAPPTLVDIHDWTDDRLIFSDLEWPPLEEPIQSRERDHHERVHQVIRVLHAGATEMAWSTRYDVDDGLEWDAKREVWVGSDGFAYDGPVEHPLAAYLGRGLRLKDPGQVSDPLWKTLDSGRGRGTPNG